MSWHKTWPQCVDLGAKLQNGEHGVIDEIKKVHWVNFHDFVESWEQRRANDEIQAVKSVLRIIQHLKKVDVQDCNLGADHLRILCDVFNGVKINRLNINRSLGHNTDAETWRQLGILVHQCGLKTLKAQMCNPTAECLERFIQETNGAQFNKLDISCSLRHNTDAEAWSQLGILVHHCGLKTLKALDCNSTAECLERFIQGTNGAQFNKLDISGSLRHNTDSETWRQLGILVHRCGLKTLQAENCNPTAECLERFIQGTNGAQINELDISHNDDMDAETWRQLGILVHQCGLKTLKAQECHPTAECLERFIQGLNGAQINELNVGFNDIDAETWRQLGILVHQCGLNTLKALWCHPTAECLERFIQGTNRAQINKLDISFNGIDAETCRQLGILVHQCGLNTLEARWCDLTAECLERFIQGTNGAQLDCIVMGLKYEDKFPISDVLKLLPLINEKLSINSWINDKKVVEALQEKLNQDHLCSLTIEYSDGFLKASPMDLPSNLSKVEDFKAETTSGIVQLNWSPLSVPNVSYYIVIETWKDGKAVGDPIITNETSCQLPYLRSETKYNFFIWGYANDAISRRVAWNCLETGEIYEHQQTIQPGILQTNGVRSSDVLDTKANKHVNGEDSALEGMQTLSDWLKTAGTCGMPGGFPGGQQQESSGGPTIEEVD